MSKTIICTTCLLLMLLLSSCASDALFEDEHEFRDKIWAYEEPQEFEFSITDSDVAYEIFYSLRYSIDYEHCNIFIKYSLIHESDTLKSGMKEGVLLDCENGAPTGNRLGENIFNRELPLLTGMQFPEKGTYKLVLKHYMRDDSLRNIYAAGVSVRKQQSP